MNYSVDHLHTEIEREFLRMEREQGTVPKSWLIRAVMARHADVYGEDREFALFCAEGHVTSQVSTFFRKMKATETDLDRQATIEGYSYIKARYLVERDGESVAVPVLSMTFGERAAKAAELRAFGSGAFAHARELERLNQRLEQEMAQ